MTQKLLKRLVQLPLTRLGCSLQKVGAKVDKRERIEERGISYKAVLIFIGQMCWVLSLQLCCDGFLGTVFFGSWEMPSLFLMPSFVSWEGRQWKSIQILQKTLGFHRSGWQHLPSRHSQLCKKHHSSQMRLVGFAGKIKHCWVQRRRQSWDPAGDSPATTLCPSPWSHPEHFQIWAYSKSRMIFLTLESVATYWSKIRWNCPHTFWHFGEFPSVSHLHQQQTSTSRPCGRGSSRAWNGNISYGNRHLQDFVHEHELLFSEL